MSLTHLDHCAARYSRWAAAQGYRLSVSERAPGEEAGLKSVELAVEGRYAYGFLKGACTPRLRRVKHKHCRARALTTLEAGVRELLHNCNIACTPGARSQARKARTGWCAAAPSMPRA